MKIGILTFHRAHNYGAVLQCYALQEVLGGLGHDVQVIDYRQPYVESVYAVFSWKRFFSLLWHLHAKTFLRYLKHIGRRVHRAYMYHHFRDVYLHLTGECCSQDIPPLEGYVIGSDQGWSLYCTEVMDKVYWGQFSRPRYSMVVGYAISATRESLYRIGERKIRECLPAFSALSFRERKIREEIFRMTGIDGEVVLDPTLLLPVHSWDKLADGNGQESVVVYLIDYRFSKKVKKGIYGKIRQLACSLHCGVTDLSDNAVSPSAFVACFKAARYVITNSFHGVAFALTFGKPLYAIRCHDMLDDRYVNLLTMVGGQAMLVDEDFLPIPLFVDYAPIGRVLDEERRKSMDYLANNLKVVHGRSC